MRVRSLVLVPFLFAACGTVHDWRELQTAPMTLGDCLDGFEHVATGQGFVVDGGVTDRGNGIWQSRWRDRVHPTNRHPARFRLYAEVLIEEGSAAKGWPIRYAVEQQIVDDLRRSIEPREEDWSNDGQDREREAILGEALVRRLAPKSAPGGSAARAQ